MASVQKAWSANWRWCLHVYSSTGRTTQTPLAFCHGWRWNKEHIAGGGPPEQKKKKKKMLKKNMMQASLTYCVARCVYVCVCAVVTLFGLAINAQLQLFCSPPGHTLAQQWHLLCGCRKIFFSPPSIEYCLWDEMRMKLQSEYDQIRISSTYISYFKLPLACEVTIFRKIVLSFFPHWRSISDMQNFNLSPSLCKLKALAKADIRAQ